VPSASPVLPMKPTTSPALTRAPFTAAVENGTALMLTGEKGRQLLVPAGVLGYVQIGESEKRGVGFGTL